MRKVITDAMTRNIETVLDPGGLTLAQLEEAAGGLSIGVSSGGRNAAA